MDSKNKGSSTSKQNGLKKLEIPKKVFSRRNSYLTNMMEINHLQSIYNIMVAAFSLLLLYAILFYITTPEKFWSDMEIMTWAFSKLIPAIPLWLSFNVFAFATLEGFKTWIQLRNKINSKVADALCLFVYVSSFVFIYVSTPYFVLSIQFPPITAFILMIEHLRITMKIYSFVRECAPRVLQYKASKDGQQLETLFPSWRHYLYYLFAPVFIYRDEYPRTEKIRWSYAFQSLFQFFACIFIAYCLFLRFVVDIFQHTALRPVNLSEAFRIYAGATFVGAAMMFLIFYCVLHAWLNFFAELLRFGDREFYQDWWNSSSFAQYYKKWNLVVYDWLYAYIYVDISKLGFNRSMSMLAVFFFSALFHEYGIGVTLGFFYPVLMCIYLTFGVSVMFLTKNRTGQVWNIFMWSTLFAGWGFIVILYASEWYARVNCHDKLFSKKDAMQEFFTPKSWNSNCRILEL